MLLYQLFILCFSVVMGSDESPPISSEPFISLLSNLDDGLLIEVLHRVPTTESAISCKSVCKLWNSLINSSYFLNRFLTHKRNHHFNLNNYRFAIFINYCNSLYKNEHFTISNKPVFESRVSLMFTCLPVEERGSIAIVASFSDLLLCCITSDASFPYRYNYYICNLFTMKWVALPSVTQKHAGPLWVGFVCEPRYSEGSVIDCKYRFRVLRLIRVRNSGLFLEMYCSETGIWVGSGVLGEEYFPRTNVVPYNGKLYWYTGLNVVGYDPFDADNSIFIDGSTFRLTAPNNGRIYGLFCIGVCRDSLRLIRLVVGGSTYNGYSNTLTVWELNDDRIGEWSLVHHVCFDAMQSENSFIQKFVKGNMKIALALGFHPVDENIVYLNFQDLVISCNLQTKDLNVVGNMPHGRHFNHSGNFFPVVLPWWPTPIGADQ